MAGSKGPTTVSTRLQRIAELARKQPTLVLTTLAHHIDLELLREAYRRTRKDGAPGVDGRTAADYEANLEENLGNLLEAFKSGTYRAPPVRRVHIPKGDGSKTRPIGIPTFEDKLLQRAVHMVLEAVYEPEFLDCSYGFRPGRSAHQALGALRQRLMEVGGGWVLEADIQGFFDALEHRVLREILDLRVRDGVLRRAIDKWLKAGVLEDGALRASEAGTPQGGVVSPLLANIYLHEVLDRWFARDVVPRLDGVAHLIRYADDFVIVFSSERDARRVLDVLPKRFGKHGLTLHPEKTRLVKLPHPFRRDTAGGGPTSFDFLGFNHHWAVTRRGKPVADQTTAKKRLARGLKAINEWCRANRHQPVEQQRAALSRKLMGHYSYYGITRNWLSLERF
jgi:group II intron reverse transcriptase/maturase